MKRLFLYISIAAACSCHAAADNNSAFEAKVSEILSNNPTLASRRANAEAESLNLRADNNLSDPELEFEHQWGTPSVGGNKWSVSVSQSFDWPGVYHSRAKAADARSRAFGLLYLAEESDMRLRVSNTLTDYIAARKQLSLALEISGNLDDIARRISQMYDHGEATVIDYRKANFERVQALSRTDAARSQVDNLRFELIELNGGRYVDLDSLCEFPACDLKSEEFYLDRHESSDPAIMAGEYLSEAAAQTAKAAARSSLPGFSLGYIHNVELGEHFNGIKAGISLPVFANRHRRAAAKAEAEAVRHSAEETTLAVSRRVMTDYAAARMLTSRIDDYKRLFPDAGAAPDYLTLLRKSFDRGQISLVVYLYEINYYNQARSEYFNLLHQRALALLSLSRFD